MSNLKPYDYQIRVAKHLLAGKCVILQAPTGAGKTHAALLPFLHAQQVDSGASFPSKCVYIVPMRVLAHQFVKEYGDMAASFNRRFRADLDVRIQTGDAPGDRRFEGDVTFCTVDQFLSSYLTMPYSLPYRFANLNAGAMVGAYLVFDEFHLLDPGSTLPSVMYALRQLGRVAPVLLMTATFSGKMLGALAEIMGAEVVIPLADEIQAILTRRGEVAPRQRTWQVADQPLSAAAILDAHERRSLALCNTVKGAQVLFRDLRDLIRQRGRATRVALLHSRFLPEHRRATEDELQKVFGKGTDPNGTDMIVVATQTIEVGVDITCEKLHTELAPASSLIQRAGRCARYPGEQGRVIVYPVAKTSPYTERLADQMHAALGWLQPRQGEVFDFGREQALVDAVATPRDELVLLDLSAGRDGRAQAIHRVLHGDRQGQDQRVLVRDADSRLVLVHANPDALLKNPYAAEGFSLPLPTLFGLFKGWQERGEGLPWQALQLVEAEAPKSDPRADNRTLYRWEAITESRQLTGARVLVVHPSLAGYLMDEGFVGDLGGTGFESSLPPQSEKETWEGFSYRLESYEDHIRLVLAAFREQAWPELRFPALALERAAGWAPGSVERAAWLTCLLHDVGKLRRDWQAWARAYQAEIGRPVPAGFAAAHTDSEWGNEAHKAAAKFIGARYPRPTHAAESALASSFILSEALDRQEPLVRASLAAMVRHHTPFVDTCPVYALEASAQSHVAPTLAYVPEDMQHMVDVSRLKMEVKSPPHAFANVLARSDHAFEWLAYVLLARALRRSDQLGTEWGSKERI